MWNKIKIFLELIKFEHTLFALPFAYLGMLLASARWPSFGLFFWVTMAMVSARTAGMTLNRIVDLEIDGKNPRTKDRPSVTGKFPLWLAWACTLAALGIFFLSAFMLNPLCFRLSPIAIIPLVVYHYVKRFSFLCHWTLGLVLAIAPMGGWIAVTGAFSWVSVFLSLAVLFWVAGFDIIYSLQDVDFDRAYGLHSAPVKFGSGPALRISAACHIATGVCLVLFGLFAQLGILYWCGVLVAGILLKVEHSLVSDGDLSRISTAFFTINGWVGILLLAFTFLETFR